MLQTPVGLYIHVPFCRRKCNHCAFFSVPGTRHILEYLECLKSEMAIYANIFKSIDTVYLGGGTPSILGAKGIEEILDSIFKYFQLASDLEISLEANPEDITREFVRAIRSIGINRLVVGIQSFADEKLGFLGRAYNGKAALDALLLAKEMDFPALCLDLIYGLTWDSPGEWERELELALGFDPQHISCYELTLEKKTRLGRIRPREAKLPEDEIVTLYELTSRKLASHGYLHYEVSNFSKGREHISRHNWKYWARLPYLGLGPAAHSFCGDQRWWNTPSLRAYIKALWSATLPIEGIETLDKEKEFLETIGLGLRTFYGISMDSQGLQALSPSRLKILQDTGYLMIHKGRIVPTLKGYLVSDSLPFQLLH